MKHSLQLKLSQHLTLTPQLQQSIRLLQLSTLELNQEIETFLQENPLLERDDEPADAPPALPSIDARFSRQPPPPATPASAEKAAAKAIERGTTRRSVNRTGRTMVTATTAAVAGRWRRYRGAAGGGRNGQTARTPARSDQSDADARPGQAHCRFLIDNLDDDGYMKQDLAELAVPCRSNWKSMPRN